MFVSRRVTSHITKVFTNVDIFGDGMTFSHRQFVLLIVYRGTYVHILACIDYVRFLTITLKVLM